MDGVLIPFGRGRESARHAGKGPLATCDEGPIMCNCLMKPMSQWLCWAALLLSLSGAGRLHAQGIDANGNGMNDVWEILYGASGLDPNADTDGDTILNRLESVAGTNPFDSNSVPRIAASAYSGSGFSVTLSCVLGKSYQLQSSRTLMSDSWSNETSMVART